MKKYSEEEIMRMRRAVSREVLKIIEDEKPETIGLGSGGTVKIFIEELPQDLLRKKCFISTSIDTSIALRNRGARCIEDLFSPERIDLYVDSADEIDRDGNLLKGGGGALFREKIVAYSSDLKIIIADETKLVSFLGEKGFLPIEIVPYAYNYVRNRLKMMSLEIKIRTGGGKLGPVISDNGNFIADIILREPIKDPEKTDLMIRSVEGVVATGIFPYKDYKIFIGEADGRILRLK
jgi:ribose 5-phosphate isomerase A